MLGKAVCRGLLLICFTFLWFVQANAQEFKSEAELKKKAEELFDEEDYISANPLFSQLLSLYPKDPNYNFKFGVCQLYTLEDKEKPLKFLEFAAKKPETEKEVFFFLGRAYHINYRFPEAITAYENFKKTGSAKSLKKYEIDQHIAMCRNGISLLKNVRDLVVLEKKSMKEEDFFRAYNTETLKGKLVVKPDEFKTSVDKKKKENSVMFISPASDALYISSYGQEDKNGKDIYCCKKLPDGSWGPPQSLGSTVNTSFDEDYPFLHADGKTLYFSSKGHNSMGGYDVFKSVYDSSTKVWGLPVNLDFAVSTPDDDIFFMPDSGMTYAYFASKRNSPAGRVDVYKLKVDVVPVEIALIKGKVISEVGGQSLDAKITVRKGEGGMIVGVFNSNPKNGEYLLNVPNGGKFIFEVESPDFAKKSEVVVVPTQYELRTLKQLIALKPSKLEISNFFDEVLSDEDTKALAMAYLKEKAKLEVNYSASQAQAQAASQDVRTTSEELSSPTNNNNTANINSSSSAGSQSKPISKFSNQELVDIAKEDAVDSRKDAEELQDKSDNASFASKKKAEEAKEKLAAANEIETAANTLTDPVKKEEELHKASLLKKEAELLSKESASVSTLAETLYKESQEKFKEAKDNEKYAADLEQAVKTNSKESILKLTEQRAQLEASATEKENDFGLQQLKTEASAKQADADKAQKSLDNLKTELAEAEAEQKTIRDQADKTKNKKEKEALVQQAELLTPDIEEKKKEIETQASKAEQLASEANAANSQLDVFTKILGGASLADISVPNNTSGSTTSTNAAASASNNSSSAAGTQSAADPGLAAVTAVDKNQVAALNAAMSKPDGAEKQKELAQVYDKWAVALQAEADKKKAGLKKISDPVKHKEESVAISALETSSAEKLALASDARSNADVLASNTSSTNTNSSSIQTSGNNATAGNPEPSGNKITAENISENTSGSNQTNSTNDTPVTSVNSSDVKDAKAKFEHANKVNADELTAAENLPSETEKDQAKVKALDKWSNDLESQNALLQKQIGVATDPEVKAALETQQAAVREKLNEVQTKGSLAFAKMERSKKQNADVAALLKTPSGKESQYSANLTKKIAATDTIADAKRRETEKANLYKEWTDEIKLEKAELEAIITKISDESSKQAISERIINLEQFSKEQELLAENSRKAAGDSGSTSSSASETASSSNNSTTTNNSTPAVNTSPVAFKSEEVLQLNNSYEKQISEAAAISDPVKKKEEEARILNAWADQLSKTSEEIRSNANTLSNEEQKRSELARADQLGVTATQKKSEANSLNAILASAAGTNASDNTSASGQTTNNASNGNAATSTENQSGAANTITSQQQNNSSETASSAQNRVEDPGPVRVEEFQNSLASIDSRPQADELSKAQEKRKVYDSWSRDIEKQLVYLKNERELTEDENKKAELSGKITEFEKELLEKQAQASLQVAKAERLKKQQIAQESLANSANPNSQENQTATENTTGNTNLQISDVNENTTQSPVLSKGVVAKLNESERLKHEADSLKRSIASIPDAATRADVLAKAATLEKESNKARSEASAEMGIVHDESFGKNSVAINQYLAASSRNQSDEVTMASMLSTESEYYHREAKKIREAMKGANPDGSTLTALERAEEYEKTSTEKQQKALTLFSKAMGTGQVIFADNGSIVNPANTSNSNYAGANNRAGQTTGQSSGETLSNSNQAASSQNQNGSTTQNTNGSSANEVNGSSSNGSASNTINGTSSGQAENQTSNEPSATNGSNGTQGSMNTNRGTEQNQGAGTTQNSGQTTENIASNQNSGGTVANNTTVENQSGTPEQQNGSETNASTIASGNENPVVSNDGKKYASKADSLNATKISGEAQRLEAVASKEDQAVESFRKAATNERSIADSLSAEAAKPERAGDKATLEAESRRHSELSKVFTERADSANSLAMNSRSAAKAKRQEAELLAISNQPKNNTSAQNNSSAGTTNTQNVNSNQQTNNQNAPGNQAGSNTTEVAIPDDYLTETNELKREIFIAYANKAAYSASRPIPINERIPNGIIFKVQVGAFRNPIAPEVLKGFAPLMGETSPNGITRYSAGFFKAFESADNARKEINGMGYRDAFVVAFCNGQRISVAEAQRFVREGKTCSTAGIASNTNANTNSNTANNTVAENRTTETIAGNANGNQAQTNAGVQTGETNGAPAANVAVQQVKGLFYTVQVGVFSTKIPASKLNFLQPLFSEPTANGLVRYSVGIYDNVDLAKKAKQVVVQSGINDAFVTAYVNGKRISVAEAQQIAAGGDGSVYATDPMINRMPVTSNGGGPADRFETSGQTQGDVVPVQVNNTQNVAVNSTVTNTADIRPAVSVVNKPVIPMSDTGLVFRVQIGAFKDEVPIDIAAKFIRIADKGVNHYTADSLTIYTVGGYREFESADIIKKAVVAEGLTDAFIVAYRRGEKIPVEEAIRMVKP